MLGKGPAILKSEDLLSAGPRPMFDLFSYHFYGAASIRCAQMGPGAQTTPEAALSEDWPALCICDRPARHRSDRYQ